MSNFLKIDNSQVFSQSRLVYLGIAIIICNLVVFGLLGYIFGENLQEMFIYGGLGILIVYVGTPIIRAIPSLIGFHLVLKKQLRQLFLIILRDNEFPKNFPPNGNPDNWLTSMKFDNDLSLEKRIMASEFLLIIQSTINSNSNLPQASSNVINCLRDAINNYQN